MRGACHLVGALLLLGAAAQPAAADERVVHAFVEQELHPQEVVCGERVEHVLRVGLDASWPSWLVPDVSRPLDLPVRVTFGADLPAGAHPVPASTTGHARFVLDGNVVHGVRERTMRAGRTYDTITVHRAWRVSEPGAYTLRAPQLVLRAGKDWSESLLGTRVPGEVVEHDVTGEEVRLEVREPPREGRPPGWVDAIGRFRITARLEPLAPAAERIVRVTVRVSGSGNLELLTPPGHGGVSGFHVLGRTDRMDAGERVVAYDLVATEPGRTALDPFELASYDPETREYLTARSDALPLPEAYRMRRGSSPPRGTPTLALALGTGLAALLAAVVGFVVVRSRRRRAPGTPTPPLAWQALLAALEQRRPDVGERFTEWVAQRVGARPASLVGDDVRARLEAAGLAPSLAERTARALDLFTRSRYGAPAAAEEVIDRDLLDAIAAATARPSGTS
ncbi:MAG: hypothetical protein AB7T63_04945 [Planctomycetota bacterium]